MAQNTMDTSAEARGPQVSLLLFWTCFCMEPLRPEDGEGMKMLLTTIGKQRNHDNNVTYYITFYRLLDYIKFNLNLIFDIQDALKNHFSTKLLPIKAWFYCHRRDWRRGIQLGNSANWSLENPIEQGANANNTTNCTCYHMLHQKLGTQIFFVHGIKSPMSTAEI